MPRPADDVTSCSIRSAETFVTRLHGFRAIVLHGVAPGGGVSVLSDGLSYLLALRRVQVWSLSVGVIRHEQNSTGCK
jgi:hypothetical protein